MFGPQVLEEGWLKFATPVFSLGGSQQITMGHGTGFLTTCV
jgi:hypothetical protein